MVPCTFLAQSINASFQTLVYPARFNQYYAHICEQVQRFFGRWFAGKQQSYHWKHVMLKILLLYAKTDSYAA